MADLRNFMKYEGSDTDGKSLSQPTTRRGSGSQLRNSAITIAGIFIVASAIAVPLRLYSSRLEESNRAKLNELREQRLKELEIERLNLQLIREKLEVENERARIEN